MSTSRRRAHPSRKTPSLLFCAIPVARIQLLGRVNTTLAAAAVENVEDSRNLQSEEDVDLGSNGRPLTKGEHRCRCNRDAYTAADIASARSLSADDEDVGDCADDVEEGWAGIDDEEEEEGSSAFNSPVAAELGVILLCEKTRLLPPLRISASSSTSDSSQTRTTMMQRSFGPSALLFPSSVDGAEATRHVVGMARCERNLATCCDE